MGKQDVTGERVLKIDADRLQIRSDDEGGVYMRLRPQPFGAYIIVQMDKENASSILKSLADALSKNP